MATARVMLALDGEQAANEPGQPKETTCQRCNKDCWLAKAQTDVMDALGEDVFMTLCEDCLMDLSSQIQHAEIVSSEDVMRRVKGNGDESHTDCTEERQA